MSSTLQSLKYTTGSLEVIDQLKLPHECVYIPVKDTEAAWSVIKKMQVRGAPLIAIVAALGLAVDVFNQRSGFKTANDAASFLLSKMEYLRTSRPTAVNLFVATDALKVVVENLLSTPNSSADFIINGYIKEAEIMLKEDVECNKSIGDHGAAKILEMTGKKKVTVLTICNTGSLATAGYGTALGVVRSLHKQGALEHVYACETRPYNQGARLTAFEIVSDGMPGSLITDSMASYLMAAKGVDCVVVGADRVAANGDTANKIGTYMLAIAAKYHKVPFFPAVPTTTLDLTMSSGATIPVELRPSVELTSIFDRKIAPDGIKAWNPAFDVTPCNLITGIITEHGVATAATDSQDGVIDIPQFLIDVKQRIDGQTTSSGAAVANPQAIPTGYTALDEKNIAPFIVTIPSCVDVIGTTDVSAIEVTEVGDGNLNFVYILKGPKGTVVAKQALPYIRCIGESWPMTLERATFECNALREQYRVCSNTDCEKLVPKVYHFEERKALIVMEFVPPPNLILRKHFMAGTELKGMAASVGRFAAHTLFKTSSLCLNGSVFRRKVSEWSRNTGLCGLTEQVIFTDPYYAAPMNRHTSPQLDNIVKEFQSDNKLKAAAAVMKSRFMTKAQALVHGDLHTGSVMASDQGTFVIDPEFAFYGPMGFDTGAFLANLLLAYYSMAGHPVPATYPDWLLMQCVEFYNNFEQVFSDLWKSHLTGEAVNSLVFGNENEYEGIRKNYLADLFRDTIGFAGMKMIRRIIGVAHVAELEEIADADLRSRCEEKALTLAKSMVLFSANSDSTSFSDIFALIKRAKEVNT